jgi:hypothetical protein
MGRIRAKMKADLELRGCASTTQKEYLRRAFNFVAYHRRCPERDRDLDLVII